MEANLGAQPATVAGEATRISKAEKDMILQAQQAVLRAEITITRKATGAVEHYTITGHPVKED